MSIGTGSVPGGPVLVLAPLVPVEAPLRVCARAARAPCETAPCGALEELPPARTATSATTAPTASAAIDAAARRRPRRIERRLASRLARRLSMSIWLAGCAAVRRWAHGARRIAGTNEIQSLIRSDLVYGHPSACSTPPGRARGRGIRGGMRALGSRAARRRRVLRRLRPGQVRGGRRGEL